MNNETTENQKSQNFQNEKEEFNSSKEQNKEFDIQKVMKPEVLDI